MLDSVLLDVAIGTALVFFLVASLVASLNEWVTRLLDIRAKVLWKGLVNALDPERSAPFSIGFFDSLRWFYGSRDLRPLIADPHIRPWQAVLSLVFGSIASALRVLEDTWRRLPGVSVSVPSRSTNPGGNPGSPLSLVTELARTPLVSSLGSVTTVGTPGRTRVDHIPGSTLANALVDAATRVGRTEIVAHVVEARQALSTAHRAGVSAVDVVDGWSLTVDHARLAGDLAAAGLDADLAQPIAASAMVWRAAAVDEAGQKERADSRLLIAARQTLPTLDHGIEQLSATLGNDGVTRLRNLTAGSPVGDVVERVARATTAEPQSDAFQDVARVTEAIGEWYDDYMVRLSELYRLAARKVLFVAGFGLAVGLNIGALDLIDDLKNHSEARTALALTAASTCGEGGDIEVCRTAVADELEAADERLTLPLFGDYTPPWDSLTGSSTDIGLAWWEVVLGWLLTGLAVSFGAPFWFDVVQRLTSYRSNPAE